MSIKYIEGGRASRAYTFVKNVQDDLADDGELKYPGAYKSYAKKIPKMIKKSGLANTFAFMLAKGKTTKDSKEYAYTLLHDQTLEWLKTEQKRFLLNGLEESYDNIPGILVNLNSYQYRAVTVEVFSLFNWLKRFAEGLIQAEEDQDN